ncbi:hypothetical protein [Streptomyces nigrescens]|uniref:hypothetical protein n=1 Tax=Streptomyces nigrescens TaxID=1920 RepID=UPI00348008FB
MRRVRGTVNRVLLGLTGVLLFGTGCQVLLSGLDLPAKMLGLRSHWHGTAQITQGILARACKRMRRLDRPHHSVVGPIQATASCAASFTSGVRAPATRHPAPGTRWGDTDMCDRWAATQSFGT